MFVSTFKILGRVVPEKSLTEKKFTHRQTKLATEQTKTIYPLYTLYAGYSYMYTQLAFFINL